jgi:hypothetical protein
MVLPLEPTDVPGVYRRGSKFVVVYRADGRQRKRSVETFAEARALKLQCAGEARALRRGPTLHAFSLAWLDRYAGTGAAGDVAAQLEDSTRRASAADLSPTASPVRSSPLLGAAECRNARNGAAEVAAVAAAAGCCGSARKTAFPEASRSP